jgi:hypothetical protein
MSAFRGKADMTRKSRYAWKWQDLARCPSCKTDIGLPSIIFHYRNQFSLTRRRSHALPVALRSDEGGMRHRSEVDIKEHFPCRFTMSALPPKADIVGRWFDVRFVPITDCFRQSPRCRGANTDIRDMKFELDQTSTGDLRPAVTRKAAGPQSPGNCTDSPRLL